MKSPVGKNDYKWTTLAECQYLCHITTHCFYFNWMQGTEKVPAPPGLGACWLKFGLGKNNTLDANKNTFGHKHTAGGLLSYYRLQGGYYLTTDCRRVIILLQTAGGLLSYCRLQGGYYLTY